MSEYYFSRAELAAMITNVGDPAGRDLRLASPLLATCPMRHICQREEYDCGLTTAAMVGGVTYDAAAALDPRPRRRHWRRGLYVPEMIVILTAARPGSRWREIIYPAGSRPRVGVADLPPGPGALLLQRADATTHWVAFVGDATGEYICDPASVGAESRATCCAHAARIKKIVVPTHLPPVRPPWLHVAQIGECDCGIAVAAMLAGRGRAATLAALAELQPGHPAMVDARGLWPAELRRLLARLTGRDWLIDVPRARRLATHSLHATCGAALIQRRGHPTGHWVAYDATLSPATISDPEYGGPLPLADYDRAAWRIVRDLRPS